MKKRIVLIIMMLLLVAQCSCASDRATGDVRVNNSEAESMIKKNGIRSQVISMADSPKEARDIAKAYGIELHDYSYGVAVYDVPKGKNIEELIQYGVDNNLPPIEQNGYVNSN